MASSETIKEFLIRLGVVSDEAGLKKLEDGILQAGKAVVGLAVAIETTAVAVAAGVARYASNLDQLYFQSQRTNTSIAALQAFAGAARNLGGDADGAKASIEGVAHALRVNPGNESWFRMFGVETRDANGQLRETSQLLIEMSKSDKFKLFSKEQLYTLEAITAKLGITENTMLAMRNPGFADEVERLQKTLDRAGLDKAAKDANQFNIKLQDLKNQVQVVSTRIGDSLFQAFGPSMEKASKWFDQHADEIVATVDIIAKALIGLSKVAAIIIETMVAPFNLLLKVLKAIADVIGLIVPKAVKDEAKKAVKWATDGLGITDDVNVLFGDGKKGERDANTPHAEEPRGIRNNNPGNLNYAGQAGAIREPDGRFAKFGTADQGLEALARQIELYAQRGYDSVRAIISKFAPPGENNTAAYIDDVSKRMHVNATASLRLGDERVLAALMNAVINHENINRNPYSSQAIMAAASKAITNNNRTVTISPQTTVTVHANGDAESTARAIGREQSRAQEAAIRYAATAAAVM